MAAAYLYHICQNRAFMDGNKRAAAFSAVLFQVLNGAPDNHLPDQTELDKVTIKRPPVICSNRKSPDSCMTEGLPRKPERLKLSNPTATTANHFFAGGTICR